MSILRWSITQMKQETLICSQCFQKLQKAQVIEGTNMIKPKIVEKYKQQISILRLKQRLQEQLDQNEFLQQQVLLEMERISLIKAQNKLRAENNEKLIFYQKIHNFINNKTNETKEYRDSLTRRIELLENKIQNQTIESQLQRKHIVGKKERLVKNAYSILKHNIIYPNLQILRELQLQKLQHIYSRQQNFLLMKDAVSEENQYMLEDHFVTFQTPLDSIEHIHLQIIKDSFMLLLRFIYSLQEILNVSQIFYLKVTQSIQSIFVNHPLINKLELSGGYITESNLIFIFIVLQDIFRALNLQFNMRNLLTQTSNDKIHQEAIITHIIQSLGYNRHLDNVFTQEQHNLNRTILKSLWFQKNYDWKYNEEENQTNLITSTQIEIDDYEIIE